MVELEKMFYNCAYNFSNSQLLNNSMLSIFFIASTLLFFSTNGGAQPNSCPNALPDAPKIQIEVTLPENDPEILLDDLQVVRLQHWNNYSSEVRPYGAFFDKRWILQNIVLRKSEAADNSISSTFCWQVVSAEARLIIFNPRIHLPKEISAQSCLGRGLTAGAKAAYAALIESTVHQAKERAVAVWQEALRGIGWMNGSQAPLELFARRLGERNVSIMAMLNSERFAPFVNDEILNAESIRACSTYERELSEAIKQVIQGRIL